ncbi:MULTISPECIES: AMP-dependent synthetase/ligase [Chitinophagaceae]
MQARSRLFDFLMPDAIGLLPEELLRYKKNDYWQFYSPQKLKELSFGLASYFVQKGYDSIGKHPEQKEKIGLICFSRPNWLVVDLASQLTGALLVPLYPNISSSEIVQIFNECELKICFLGDMDLYEKITALKDQLPHLKEIFVFDGATPRDICWTSVIQPFTSGLETFIMDLSGQVKEEDVATIIYTSGTTGTPKGVMLSHKNILSNIGEVTDKIFPEIGLSSQERKSLSFLPLNHILEKMIMYTYLYNQVSVSFAEKIDKVGENLLEVKPYLFVTVPRLLEKVYEKILQKGHALTGFKKKIFFWAMSLASQYELDESQFSWSYKIKLKIADKLVFSKWREALGGNVKVIIVGGAACQPRLIRLFSAARIVILEGYGLTETSPVISVNRFPVAKRKIGTVGLVLDNVQVKFMEDGEICCKGDNVMVGYYKRPQETADVIQDGWFKTGDIGEMDGSFLKITDRKKEIFKTSGGKFVVPQPIENKMKENFLIGQICLIGEQQKFVTALIVPNFNSLKAWCNRHGVVFTSNADIVKNLSVIQTYQDAIDRFNPMFNHVEQIKKFTLLPNEWTVESGELTPSEKMKRKVIIKKYANEINTMYGNTEDTTI